MATINDLQLGGFDDTVVLRLGKNLSGGGEKEDVHIVEHYEVKMSVMQQPAAFTLRLGSSSTAAEIIAKYPPGTQFELHIGPAGHRSQVQSGVVYSRGSPSGHFSQVELRGRDYLAVLYDDEIQSEYTFAEKTYFELTRKVLDIVGLRETGGAFPKFILNFSNDSNRQLISRVATAKPKSAGELVTQIETGATAGAGKVVYQTLKSKVGTRWYDFLQQQYKLAGLFLWATGEGNFVLTRPRADMAPTYKIQRQRGAIQNHGNVVECRFQDDTTNRHSEVIVHGRGGRGKSGRGGIYGHWVDTEMRAYGFANVRTIQDDDVKSNREAEFVARKTIAEERRAGWQLEYTLSGHVTPSVVAKDSTAVWCPDMVCRVDDEELNIHGNYYIEHVTFARGPQTTTTVTLMRPEDLIFADDLFVAPAGTGKKSTKPLDTTAARQALAEKFAAENFGTPAGPTDLIEGLRN